MVFKHKYSSDIKQLAVEDYLSGKFTESEVLKSSGTGESMIMDKGSIYLYLSTLPDTDLVP